MVIAVKWAMTRLELRMRLYRITFKYEPVEIEVLAIETIQEEHFIDDSDSLAIMNAIKFIKNRMKANKEYESTIEAKEVSLTLTCVLIRRVLYQRIDHSGYIPSFIKPFTWKWDGKGIDAYEKSAKSEAEKLQKSI